MQIKSVFQNPAGSEIDYRKQNSEKCSVLDKEISVDGSEKMIDQEFGDYKSEKQHHICGINKPDRQKRRRPKKLKYQECAEQSRSPFPFRVLKSRNQRQPLAEQEIRSQKHKAVFQKKQLGFIRQKEKSEYRIKKQKRGNIIQPASADEHEILDAENQIEYQRKKQNRRQDERSSIQFLQRYHR